MEAKLEIALKSSGNYYQEWAWLLTLEKTMFVLTI